jgi:hypothetical protein
MPDDAPSRPTVETEPAPRDWMTSPEEELWRAIDAAAHGRCPRRIVRVRIIRSAGSSAIQSTAIGGPHPRLGGNLDGIPGRAEGRRVGQVEVIERIDRHGGEQCRGEHIHALGISAPCLPTSWAPISSPDAVSPVTRRSIVVAPG